MASTFADWKDRIAWTSLVGMGGILATWIGWVTVQLQASPYLEDRNLILSELGRIERVEVNWNVRFTQQQEATKANAAAIADLEAELKVIRAILEERRRQPIGPEQ